MTKAVQVLSLVLLGLMVAACSIRTVRNSDDVESSGDEGPSSEYSLKADRSQLNELRKDIPEPVKKENDDLAGVLAMFTDGLKRSPNEIRSKFERRVRKTRDRFKKDLKKQRKNFGRDEKRKRNKYLAKAKSDRTRFTAVTRGNEERKLFFNQQRQDRSEFFAQERDDRKEFESEMRQKSNDFNAYIRETRREFYDLHRDYSKRFYENKTLEKRKKKMEKAARVKAMQNSFNNNSGVIQQKAPSGRPAQGRSSGVLEEFNELDQVPGQPLSPDGN